MNAEHQNIMSSFLQSLKPEMSGTEDKDAFLKAWEDLVAHFPALTSAIDGALNEAQRWPGHHENAMKALKAEAERTHAQVLLTREMEIKDERRVTQAQRDEFSAVIFQKAFYNEKTF